MKSEMTPQDDNDGEQYWLLGAESQEDDTSQTLDDLLQAGDEKSKRESSPASQLKGQLTPFLKLNLDAKERKAVETLIKNVLSSKELKDFNDKIEFERLVRGVIAGLLGILGVMVTDNFFQMETTVQLFADVLVMIATVVAIIGYYKSKRKNTYHPQSEQAERNISIMVETLGLDLELDDDEMSEALMNVAGRENQRRKLQDEYPQYTVYVDEFKAKVETRTEENGLEDTRL